MDEKKHKQEYLANDVLDSGFRRNDGLFTNLSTDCQSGRYTSGFHFAQERAWGHRDY
jgi:hypothetical protein